MKRDLLGFSKSFHFCCVAKKLFCGVLNDLLKGFWLFQYNTMSTTEHAVSYKNADKTMDNMKQKRREGAVKIRKAQRQEQHLKRRNIVLDDLNTSPLKEINSDVGDFANATGISMSFEEVVKGIHDDSDHNKQFICTQNARKILSRERHPPIGDMIDANIIPKLVSFLMRDDLNLQFEAAWALTNIASGSPDQTAAVVEGGAVPALIKMLYHTAQNVVEQAVWALGNIAGDGAKLRDHLLENGIIQPLVRLVENIEFDSQISFLQNITWTVSNLCRNKNPHTALPYIVQLLPMVVSLAACPDTQVRTDACWALSYITDGPNERIELVINTGIVAKLVEVLTQVQDILIITPVLRTLGNIVTGTDKQTQVVVDSGVLPAFHYLLNHEKATVQKEASWTLSNITAGTQLQIQAVVEANIMPRVIKLLDNADYKTQKEACWAVTNFTSGASLEQLCYLMQLGAVEGLVKMMGANEPKILQVCLDGLSNILAAAGKLGKLEAIVECIEECGGLDKIEDLQQHDNVDVYKMSFHIIDTYFSDEVNVEDVALVPDQTQHGFCFSSQHMREFSL